jgi:hypothetical protein
LAATALAANLAAQLLARYPVFTPEYPSHGLRFKVIRAAETLNEFKLRINAHDREEDCDEDHAGETGTWDFGADQRVREGVGRERFGWPARTV